MDDRSRRLVLAAIGGLGLSAVMTQLALTRELLCAFSGNELVMGLCLGSWLLLTGLGTWLGRFTWRWSLQALGAGLVAIALLPLLQVVAVRALRDLVFPRGAAVGVLETAAGCIVLLLPFCLLSGILLTCACRLLASPENKNSGIGRVYTADAAGSIAGGVLFSFILVFWFDHFALLCFPAFLNLGLAGLLAWRTKARALSALAGTCALALLATITVLNIDDLSTALQHPGRLVVFRAGSPYGRLVVTDDSGQLDFIESGMPLLSSQMTEQLEETAHYPLSQRPDARRVLLISGGVAGAAREILRYPGVEQVTCIELDPLIVEASRRFLPDRLSDPRIRVITTDGRRFLRETSERFDIVIVAGPDPSSALHNRYFTAEFFAEARRALVPGGVLCFGLGRYENYVSRDLASLLASARRTVQGAFANVLLIPGGRVFFLASDGPLTLDIAARLEERGIATQLVKRAYLDAMLTPDRLADLERAIAQPAALNTDFNPVLYYHHLRHWLGQFASPGGLLPACVLLALLAVYLWRLHAVPRTLFASGFAATALEVVILLAYQGLYGSLYRQVGLIVTVFMTGLTLGAWLSGRRCFSRPSHSLASLGFGIALLSALLPFALQGLGGFDTALGAPLAGQAAVLLLTLLLATMVGAQFPLAGAASPPGDDRAASRLYTADLVGSSLGALLVSTLAIPLLGMTAVCLLTAGLNLLAAALVYRRSATP